MSALPKDRGRSEFREDEVELGDQRIQKAGQIGSVQQVGDIAEQIAKQVAIAGDCHDVEYDLVQRDLQAQDVQVQWAEGQAKDGARGSHSGHGQGSRLICHLRDGSSGTGYGAIQYAIRDQLISLIGKALDRKYSAECVTEGISSLDISGGEVGCGGRGRGGRHGAGTGHHHRAKGK